MRRSSLLATCLSAVLLLAGCDGAVTSPRPEAARADDGPDCTWNNESSLRPCTDTNTGYGGPGYKFFSTMSYDLYEPAGDPAPGSPGVWLGWNVTPDACFTHTIGTVIQGDDDGDALQQHCETALARSFAPVLNYYQGENCGHGEPVWAVKRFPDGTVRIAYMPAYYDDCGYHGHTGDSEFIMVEVEYNGNTGHWQFRKMWLSAHDSNAFFSVNSSAWVPASGTEFALRHLGPPTVYVSEDKHANYKSISACHWSHGSNDGPYADWCGSGGPERIRFPVRDGRNAGSRYLDLLGGVPRVAGGGREEVFYSLRGDGSGFQGWNLNKEGDRAKSYHEILFTYRFEHYEDANGFWWTNY